MAQINVQIKRKRRNRQYHEIFLRFGQKILFLVFEYCRLNSRAIFDEIVSEDFPLL